MINEINAMIVWSDEHLIELMFSSRTEAISSSIKFYTNEEEILDKSKELRSWFPTQLGEELVIEFGDDSISHIGYINLKFALADIRGRVTITVCMKHDTGHSDSYFSEMIMKSDIPSVNSFGKEFKELIYDYTGSIRMECR